MPKLSLFWVTTADHHEDDFVVACSRNEAAEFLENYVGYDPSDAKAERLEDIMERHESPYYADHRLLARLGYKKMTRKSPVIFAKHGRIFCAGEIGYRLFLDEVRRKSGVYVIRALDTRQYKIGITRDIEARIRKLQTGSPTRLHARMFVQCSRPRVLESVLHDWLKARRASQEWFHLSTKEYLELRLMLFALSARDSAIKVSDYDLYPEMP